MRTISANIPEIDRLLEGGFPRGQVFVVSGRPNSGKSMLAMYLLAKACETDDIRAAVYSELHDPQVAYRFQRLGVSPDVTSKIFTTGRVTPYKRNADNTDFEYNEDGTMVREKSPVDLVRAIGERTPAAASVLLIDYAIRFLPPLGGGLVCKIQPETWKNLVGLAQVRNLCIIFTMQTNRSVNPETLPEVEQQIQFPITREGVTKTMKLGLRRTSLQIDDHDSVAGIHVSRIWEMEDK